MIEFVFEFVFEALRTAFMTTIGYFFFSVGVLALGVAVLAVYKTFSWLAGER